MATGTATKTSNKHVQHTFLYISFLHGYDGKMPNLTFYGVSKLRHFFSLSKLEWGAQKINTREFAYI